MEIGNTNDTLTQTVKAVVLDVLKDVALKEIDGVYSFEVAPIPVDKLSHEEVHRISTADNPESKLLEVVGGRYFDMIDATEQNFYQSCVARVQELMPNSETADIINVLAHVVRINPPVAYYMAQLSLYGEEA